MIGDRSPLGLLRKIRGLTLVACVSLLVACESVMTEENPLEKAQPAQMTAGIKPIENSLLLEQSMEVLFYLYNGTDDAVEVLPWGTPLERRMTADRFEITSAGETIPYGGPVVKRPAPVAEDYLTLEAGEKREMVVNLSESYEVSGSGEYRIDLRDLQFQTQANGFAEPAIIEPTVTITRQ